jgi:hypothetical protein
MIDNSTDWYWQCGDLKTQNKYQAIQKQVANPSLTLDFKIPACYYSYDFSKEPLQSWEEILYKRALYIRENSNYVKLWYSGGCDSFKMLTSFLDNNIFIDEISMLKSGIPACDFEIDNTAIPWLLENKNKIHPKTKIKIHNPGVDIYNHRYVQNNKSFCVTTPNMQYTRMNNILEREIIQKESNTTHLYGREKPTLFYKDASWYFYHFDLAIEPMDKASNLCYFYTGDVEVHSKQCHMLKNHIEKNFDVSQYDSLKKYANNITQRHKNFGSGRLEHMQDNFISKVFNPTQTVVGELSSWSSTGKEKLAREFFSFYEPSIIKAFNQEMDTIAKLGDGKWFNHGRPELGTVGVYSDFISMTDPFVYKNSTELF